MNMEKLIDIAICTVISFLLGLIAPLLFSVKFLEPVKNYIADFDVTDMYFSRIKEEITDTNIVLMNIDNLSHRNIARNIEEMLKQNPAVIAVDRNFDFDGINADGNYLKRVLTSDDRIVVSFPLTDDEDQLLEYLEKDINLYKNSGYSNLLFEKKKEFFVIRTFTPFYDMKDHSFPSLAYQTAKIFNPKAAKDLLKRNKKSERINYIGGQEVFFNIDPIDFENDTSMMEPDYVLSLQNKIILMGKMRDLSGRKLNSKLDDMYLTPISADSTGREFTAPDMHSTVIQANIISTIINGKYLNTQPIFVKYLATFLVSMLNSFLFIFILYKARGLYYIICLLILPVESNLAVYICFKLIESNNFLFDINPIMFVIPVSFIVTDIYIKYLKRIYERIRRQRLAKQQEKLARYISR